VRYGGFTACNINAVTKSGTNEFSGSVWYDMTSDSLTGDSLEGEDVAVGDYDKDRYGFTLGGPILQDQLFFFVTYEKQNGVDLQEKGPQGSGAISEVAVTQAQIDEIAQISRDIYQYNPGFIPSAFDNEDEKITAKLDWYINDDHRLSFFYNYNDGFTMVCEGRGNTGRLGFSNHSKSVVIIVEERQPVIIVDIPVEFRCNFFIFVVKSRRNESRIILVDVSRNLCDLINLCLSHSDFGNSAGTLWTLFLQINAILLFIGHEKK
jgi:hypothetical protein